MNVYAIGASRNIGYHASLRLLRKGATVTFLLRSQNAFKDVPEIQEYITSGKAILVQGDALKEEDVARGWAASQAASPTSQVDLALFTLGGTPTIGFKGAIINPPDLCTHCLLNVIRTTPESLRSTVKLLAITSTGATRGSHDNLPLPWKPFYSWFLAGPHKDKLGMERVLYWCMGQRWEEPEPEQSILGSGWQAKDNTPGEGALKHVVVVRPALLTDGECVADNNKKPHKAPYKFGTDEELRKHNGYTVSRKDVAHFLVEEAIPNWERYEGKAINVCY
ncbi:hypothetical protein BDY19DRAFT_900055 [Irpex rosettiformis]|uniref:Uncharacterized protein n=1 Tax=Irpex rosettiformis TaxID=378272 RepID=A0ACB8TNN9_9APHY|nr:hypothetical protein BDY19DRAFT_900055 [Irpex rosettiformis]